MIYKIADLIIEMNTFGITQTRAEKYLCDSSLSPDYKLVSHWESKKALHPDVSDDVGEYMSTGTVFYNHLLHHNGFMLHSSAIVVDSKAYLFTADSGVGKSTHTSLWQKLLGDRAFMLNDDKPALRYYDGKWYAYGTPWSGKYDISANFKVELGGIAVIKRAKDNKIERFCGIEAVSEIFRQVNRPKDPKARAVILELLDKLLAEIPVWSLECNTDIDAARMAYEAMSENIT